jgi:hypothetical protein
MEVQVREKCWECKGTGQRVFKREPSDLIEQCDCGDGWRYRWMDIGELLSVMEKRKPVWEDERERERWWNS